MKLTTKLKEALDSLRDHATVSAAAITGRNILTDIEIALLRGTDHREVPASEKYVHEILFLVSNTPGSINFLARQISVRLEGARDPVVVVKTLMLVHRLLRGGDRFFEQDLRNLWLSGALQMDMQRSSTVSDRLGPFILNYSQFLKARMEWIINQAGKLEPVRPSALEFQSLEEEGIELVLHRLSRCQILLDRIIDCLPVSISGSSRVMRLAMNIILKESFRVYASFCEGFEIVASSFFDLKKPARVLALDILKKACIQTPNIHEFYEECKRIFGRANLDYPSVKIITAAEISAMEQFSDHHKSVECKSEGRNISQEAKVETEQTLPALFSSKFETKISTVWVEFDEEDSQTSVNSIGALDDLLTGSDLLAEGESSTSERMLQLL